MGKIHGMIFEGFKITLPRKEIIPPNQQSTRQDCVCSCSFGHDPRFFIAHHIIMDSQVRGSGGLLLRGQPELSKSSDLVQSIQNQLYQKIL